MKKTYFNPALVDRNFLPTITSRRIFGHSASNNANVSYRSGGGKGGDDDDDDEDEDDGSEKALLMSKITKSVKKELGTRATVKEVNELKEQLKFLTEKDENGNTKFPIEALRAMAAAGDKGVMGMLAAQGLELQRLEQAMNNSPADLSIRSQVAGWMKTNEAAIKSIRSGTQALLAPFELKPMETRAANNPMLPSNTMPNGSGFITRYEVAPGINDPLRFEPTFWNYIRKGSTNAETYKWVNKVVPEGSGAAAFIAPGVYKPNVSFQIVVESSNAKKVADSLKCATELLEDIDGFTSMIEDELRFKVMEKVNEAVMTGVSSATMIDGVQTLSVAYAGGVLGLGTTNANRWDAIRAGVAQLRRAKFKGKIVALLNPIDKANMEMTKAVSQGQTFTPYAVGADIVEDQNAALGSLQLVAIDYYKILIYKPFRISWGWENDDFTHNLVTVIGEMRMHQFHNSQYDGFAIYDTFANIINSLNTVGDGTVVPA